MFLGINSIYTPVYLPLCEYGQNQPPCADVGLLLNMARTCSFHSLVWAILRSNPPSLHVGWFFKIYPSGALRVYFPIYTPRSIYRSVYLIEYHLQLTLMTTLSSIRSPPSAYSYHHLHITFITTFNPFVSPPSAKSDLHLLTLTTFI